MHFHTYQNRITQFIGTKDELEAVRRIFGIKKETKEILELKATIAELEEKVRKLEEEKAITNQRVKLALLGVEKTQSMLDRIHNTTSK